MKLFLLRPMPKTRDWSPWYDKCFGMVVRARNEESARLLASYQSGAEGKKVWTNPKKTSCTLLTCKGQEEVVIRDECRA